MYVINKQSGKPTVILWKFDPATLHSTLSMIVFQTDFALNEEPNGSPK